jgi:uncharacterized membrane protein
MEINSENIVFFLATILTGLHAGLMYAFTVAVVPALQNVKAKEHISVFQSINVKIENPVFFLCFFGPIVLLPIATYQHRGESEFIWLLVATILQLVFSELVTIAGNIPINKKLAQVDVNNITEEEAEVIRKKFQGSYVTPWMILHHVRTVASIVALSLLIGVGMN